MIRVGIAMLIFAARVHVPVARQGYGTRYDSGYFIAVLCVYQLTLQQNWYSQAVLIPQLCATTCLLLKGANLTASQQAGCERIPRRAYDLRDGSYGTGGNLTGANVRQLLEMRESATTD